MMKITAVVLTKNSKEVIRRCLESILWADEIIVVDDYSTDRTVGIIQKYKSKVKVFRRHLNNDFASQRNFGLRQARGEWVLFVDSDEVVSPRLQAEIFNATGANAFKIKRQDVMWKKKLRFGESGNIKLLRLAKKSAGKWKRKVHEYWDISGEIGELKGELIHYPHQTLRQFITQINFHSSLHARENIKEGKKSSIIKIIFFPIFKFLDNYFLKLGLLDGMPGFIAAAVMSWHSYLSWSKMYIWQRN